MPSRQNPELASIISRFQRELDSFILRISGQSQPSKADAFVEGLTFGLYQADTVRHTPSPADEFVSGLTFGLYKVRR